MSVFKITDADLEAKYGPNWKKVAAVVRRAAVVTGREAKTLSRTWDAGWYEARDAATRAAKARFGAAYESWDAVSEAASDVAVAYSVADLVGQHGLIQEHIDTLLSPWLTVLGEDWEMNR